MGRKRIDLAKMLKGEIAQKVPDGFRRRFKIRAAEEGITGVELLRRLFDAS